MGWYWGDGWQGMQNQRNCFAKGVGARSGRNELDGRAAGPVLEHFWPGLQNLGAGIQSLINGLGKGLGARSDRNGLELTAAGQVLEHFWQGLQNLRN